MRRFIFWAKLSVSIKNFKVHTFLNMKTIPQAFFFYIPLKRTLYHEEWCQFHFSTMICVGITTSVAFFLSTTVHNYTISFTVIVLPIINKNFYKMWAYYVTFFSLFKSISMFAFLKNKKISLHQWLTTATPVLNSQQGLCSGTGMSVETSIQDILVCNRVIAMYFFFSYLLLFIYLQKTFS